MILALATHAAYAFERELFLAGIDSWDWSERLGVLLVEWRLDATGWSVELPGPLTYLRFDGRRTGEARKDERAAVTL